MQCESAFLAQKGHIEMLAAIFTIGNMISVLLAGSGLLFIISGKKKK